MLSARCKPDPELVVQQNINEGRIFEDTVEEGPLVEGAIFEISTNGKTARGLAAKNTVNKEIGR